MPYVTLDFRKGEIMQNKQLKQIFNFALATGILFLLTGCATHHHTYHQSSTTTTAATDANGNVVSSDQDRGVVESSTTEETTTTKTEEHHGLVGGFFHFLGEVVAFPFRVIGGIFDAIF